MAPDASSGVGAQIGGGAIQGTPADHCDGACARRTCRFDAGGWGQMGRAAVRYAGAGRVIRTYLAQTPVLLWRHGA